MSRRAGMLAALLAGAAVAGLPACRRAEALPRGPALLLRLAQDPATLDPAHASDAHAVAVVSQIFDGLVAFDPADLSVRPALAGRWEVSADGLRYVFHLRPDARFHDGRPVTARDVAFSFARVLSSRTASERRWVLSQIAGARAFWDSGAPPSAPVAGIRVLDPLTVELRLERPFAPFLSLLALEAASVVPRAVYDAPAGAPPDRPVGSGPFALESWARGERITLRRAAPSSEAGAIGQVVYRIIASEATALEEYLAGGLDVADEVPAGRRSEVAARLAGEYRRRAQPAIAYLGFNHRAPPFRGNRALRRAFNHAVDKRYICDVINEGKDVPATGVVPHGVPGHDPHLQGYPYDPMRARALLAEAGHPAGRGLPEITLYYNTSQSQRRIMERVQMDLARIGVRVRLKSLDPPALMKSLEAGAPLLFRMAWLADYPDPDAFFTPALHGRSGPADGNFARYENPELDGLLDAARAEHDPERRMELYRKAQRLAVEDACWLFLYFYGDDALVKPRVRGLTLPALGDFLAPLQGVSIATAAS